MTRLWLLSQTLKIIVTEMKTQEVEVEECRSGREWPLLFTMPLLKQMLDNLANIANTKTQVVEGYRSGREWPLLFTMPLLKQIRRILDNLENTVNTKTQVVEGSRLAGNDPGRAPCPARYQFPCSCSANALSPLSTSSFFIKCTFLIIIQYLIYICNTFIQMIGIVPVEATKRWSYQICRQTTIFINETKQRDTNQTKA